MLRISNLKAGYDGALVLRGVDIEVRSGEIVVLIGPNGAGKSTVLKSIFNLVDIESGEVIFKGKNITRFKTCELLELGISFVPQGRQVFSTMSVLENLYMGAYTIKDKVRTQRKIHDIFKKFSTLKRKQNDLASTLSGGQQQILAISRALIQNPQLLLMDEPSLGLSPKAMQKFFDKIIEIRNEGIAILLVEQNAYQAVSIADRTYILESGKIALTGGKDILEDSRVKEVYFSGNLEKSAD